MYETILTPQCNYTHRYCINHKLSRASVSLLWSRLKRFYLDVVRDKHCICLQYDTTRLFQFSFLNQAPKREITRDFWSLLRIWAAVEMSVSTSHQKAGRAWVWVWQIKSCTKSLVMSNLVFHLAGSTFFKVKIFFFFFWPLPVTSSQQAHDFPNHHV